MVTLSCGKPQPNRDSSSSYLLSRPERLMGSSFNQTGLRRQPAQPSCTVKDSRQLIRMFAFALESQPDRSEGLGERKNVVCDKQIAILRPDRMPVHTLSSNRHFRHQIGPSNGD